MVDLQEIDNREALEKYEADLMAALKLAEKICKMQSAGYVAQIFLEDYFNFLGGKIDPDLMLEAPYEAYCDGIITKWDYIEFRAHFTEELESHFKRLNEKTSAKGGDSVVENELDRLLDENANRTEGKEEI